MTYTELKTLIGIIKREETKRIEETVMLDIDYIEHFVSESNQEIEKTKKIMQKNIDTEKLNAIIDDLLGIIDRY